ncbi:MULTISPECIES: gpW family head-tail joining protein [unclassified Variovorax]|uniref:gpW family head-tail joining protein n=1 Tax=unclassified Variovorax TaxID=663243 RepID=UPI003F471FD4
MFRRRTSILDGISLEALQAQLAALQKAYLDLMAGGKVATASYTQGDGARSVTYTQANIGDLTQAILAVQTQIDGLTGQCINRRAPLRPYF